MRDFEKCGSSLIIRFFDFEGGFDGSDKCEKLETFFVLPSFVTVPCKKSPCVRDFIDHLLLYLRVGTESHGETEYRELGELVCAKNRHNGTRLHCWPLEKRTQKFDILLQFILVFRLGRWSLLVSPHQSAGRSALSASSKATPFNSVKSQKRTCYLFSAQTESI